MLNFFENQQKREDKKTPLDKRGKKLIKKQEGTAGKKAKKKDEESSMLKKSNVNLNVNSL